MKEVINRKGGNPSTWLLAYISRESLKLEIGAGALQLFYR